MSKALKIHFVGIGGIGISGLAKYLKAQGAEVSGSDITEGSTTKYLKKMGIPLSIPHDAEIITDQELLIHSAIIKPDNIELVRAKERGITILSRAEALPMILGDKRVYAVAGAHGKSTTTAILSSLLPDCSAIIGAESKEFGSNVREVRSECVVFEADESDRSFLNSNPYCAIVTNAEPEHMENYNYDLELFHGAYREFLQKAKKRVINAEDAFLSTLTSLEATRLYPSHDITELSYELIEGEPYTRFKLLDLGDFRVWGLGEHIALDASLAILAVRDEMPLALIKERLQNFKGIKKRFDILQKSAPILIDDYAHHPTEIEATLGAVKKYSALLGDLPVTAIWQPHKYSRTLSNLERFIECFKGVDRLIILPVYAAGEKPVSLDFQTLFKRYSPLFATHLKRESLGLSLWHEGTLLEELKEGLIVGFGAGDITYQLRGGI
ncbi:UDP-N-acetylmuramate--L-alanine ligase [Wolinella succinogenes]|uniref:UDP-N-acetylmuramate--L-alanine ligase n=1 Tax=Wolinella succinogenes TaxID=844 RepID=UPI002408F4A1|nr:UDP-N-acetylmuramate--L-alanine ligase [Wolinella succinogenes]